MVALRSQLKDAFVKLKGPLTTSKVSVPLTMPKVSVRLEDLEQELSKEVLTVMDVRILEQEPGQPQALRTS